MAWPEHVKTNADAAREYERTNWLATVETDDGSRRDMVFSADTELEALTEMYKVVKSGAWSARGARLVGWRPHTWKEYERDKFESNYMSFDYEPSGKRNPDSPDVDVSQKELLRGQHQLTHDDLLDMWQKAKTLPEPDRTKAIRYITHLSTRLESKPSQMLVNILLENQVTLKSIAFREWKSRSF